MVTKLYLEVVGEFENLFEVQKLLGLEIDVPFMATKLRMEFVVSPFYDEETFETEDVLFSIMKMNDCTIKSHTIA